MSHTINKHQRSELHRLHEINYLLLMQLIPNLEGIDESARSSITGGPDLHLRVVEHTPYTTVVALTHHVPVGNIHVAAPDLWLRIYHDARVAEAIAHNDGLGPAHARVYTRHQELDRDIKWALNKFAARWLRGCLKMGHLLFTETDDLSCEGCIGEAG